MSGDSVRKPRIDQVRPPTSDNVSYIPVVSPKPGVIVRAVLLGGYTFSCNTHWIDNRTIPHVEPAEICQGCLGQRRKRWKGYLAGWLPGPSRKCIIEVTAEAARNCPALFDGAQDLRGHVLAMSRIGKAANAPVKAELTCPPRGAPATNLPKPFNLAAALYRLWGLAFDCVTDQGAHLGDGVIAYDLVDLRAREEGDDNG